MSADEIRNLERALSVNDFIFKEGFCVCTSDQNGNLVCSTSKTGTVRAALLAYAAMVEHCEERIEELGKCCSYKKNNGVCPAARGEEVNLYNCLDESCPNDSVIKELKEILKKGATDA